MYGIINKAIEDLVKENYGEVVWNKVLIISGIEIDFFISNEPYDDDITFKLAEAIAQECKISLSNVLTAFGEWWVLKTAAQKYGSLMQAGGNGLKEFLINLPMFHTRIMLIYPKLTPPEFKVTQIEERSLLVHYYSKRQGLKDFVYGLLIGLGKMYNTPAEIELIEERDSGHDHEVFKVSW